MKKSLCPVCDVEVTLENNTEESEIISCPECKTRLVVTSLKMKSAILEESPKIEEDWGE